MLIDDGQIDEAKYVLDNFLQENDFSENEKDIKLLMYSLSGILKKNFCKNHDEEIEGMELIESSK